MKINNRLINYIILVFLILAPNLNLIIQFLVSRVPFLSFSLLWKEFLFLLVLFVYLNSLRKINKKILLFTFLISIFIFFNLILKNPNQTFSFNYLLLSFRFELLWWYLLIFLFSILSAGEIKINNTFFNVGIFVGVILSLFQSFFIFLVGESKVLEFVNTSKNIGSNIIQLQNCNQIDFQNTFCRMSGGFNHPNHYATYLILVLGYVLFKTIQTQIFLVKFSLVFLSFLILFAIYLTDSKAAIISLIFIFLFIVIMKLKNFQLIRISKIILVSIALFGSTFFLLTFGTNTNKVPEFLRKSTSTIEHLQLSNSALGVIKKDFPKNVIQGYGLGATGPASKDVYRNYETSKYIKQNKEDLNIFNLNISRTTVPENWFYQLVLNGGILYLILYMIPFLYFIFITNKVEYFPLIGSLTSLYFINSVLHVFESSVVFIYSVLLICFLYSNKREVDIINI
ncbi:MAG: O-antigen ligase family protein [Patescibacteria group bacterium]